MLDAETLGMFEGALAVAELQVRDIMVPRSDMTCLRRDDPLASILPARGHLRPLALPGARG